MGEKRKKFTEASRLEFRNTQGTPAQFYSFRETFGWKVANREMQ